MKYTVGKPFWFLTLLFFWLLACYGAGLHYIFLFPKTVKIGNVRQSKGFPTVFFFFQTDIKIGGEAWITCADTNFFFVETIANGFKRLV